MRWYIIRTLLVKEALRHLADRGAIFLALILIAATLLLSLFGKEDAQSQGLTEGVKLFYVDYEQSNDWVEYLAARRPRGGPRPLIVRFRPIRVIPRNEQGQLIPEPRSASVQVLVEGGNGDGRPNYVLKFSNPGGDRASLAPYLDWFWKQSLQFFREGAVEIDTPDDQAIYPPGEALVQVRPGEKDEAGRQHYKLLFGGRPSSGTALTDRLTKDALSAFQAPVTVAVREQQDTEASSDRTMFVTGFVLFPLCFFSVYLLPAMTCEEREKGLLLAQALSPASTLEILAAKFLFYPTMGVALGTLLAGIYNPPVLSRPFFWLSLLATSVGFLGVGLCISSLARTQRAASMGALCYMMTVALLLVLASRFGLNFLQYLFLEFYGPRILHAAMQGRIAIAEKSYLIAAALLAACWVTASAVIFRRRGWQ